MKKVLSWKVIIILMVVIYILGAIFYTEAVLGASLTIFGLICILLFIINIIYLFVIDIGKKKIQKSISNSAINVSVKRWFRIFKVTFWLAYSALVVILAITIGKDDWGFYDNGVIAKIIILGVFIALPLYFTVKSLIVYVQKGES